MRKRRARLSKVDLVLQGSWARQAPKSVLEGDPMAHLRISPEASRQDGNPFSRRLGEWCCCCQCVMVAGSAVVLTRG